MYTTNIVASHDTYIGLRKSYGVINAIWYMRLSSGSDLSAGFIGLFGTCLSYTVNKHKLTTINILFVTNPFLTQQKHIPFFLKRSLKMFQPSKEGVKGLPH